MNDSYTKQIWQDYPNTSTPITADRLNHMEDGIEGAWSHGTGVTVHDSYSSSTSEPYSANYVNNAIIDTYSTTEVKTNKIWINNKPIYRKVIEITSGFSTSFNVPHNISNLDVLRVSGYIYGSSTNGSPVYYYSSTDYFRLFWNGNNVSVRYGSGVSPVKIEIIMEYTKTTD